VTGIIPLTSSYSFYFTLFFYFFLEVDLGGFFLFCFLFYLFIRVESQLNFTVTRKCTQNLNKLKTKLIGQKKLMKKNKPQINKIQLLSSDPISC
jgi:hypothetical protein